MPEQRLMRRRDERIIAGVCAGLADYYNISVTRLRWAFVVFGVFGAGEIVYVLLWMLISKEKEKEDWRPASDGRDRAS